MDFPKPLGLSIQLMGSHPILSATIVGCVVGAAYWMSGYRPSLPLSRPKKANGQANPAEKQSLIDQGMTISTTASQMDRLTGPCTSEQLSAYADSISIQQDTFGREIANGKYLIGQMRFLDKQKGTDLLRYIKAIHFPTPDTLSLERVKVELRVSCQRTRDHVSQVLDDLFALQGINLSVKAQAYPLSCVYTNYLHEPIIPEFAGYLAAFARSEGVSITELEIKLHSIELLDKQTVLVQWRSEEVIQDTLQELMLSAWKAFYGTANLVESDSAIKFKQTIIKTHPASEQSLASVGSAEVATTSVQGQYSAGLRPH